MEGKNWKLKIENIEFELKVNNISTMQLKVKEAIITLRVHMFPPFQWDCQFKVIKDKMIESIAKLNDTEIIPYLMHLYFNTCSL